jgi:integrase
MPAHGPAQLKEIKHPRYAYAVIYSDPSRREPSGRAKRVALYFKRGEKEAAEKKLADLNRDLIVSGTIGASMDAAARADYFAAREVLTRAGHVITLAEAARHYVIHHPQLAALEEEVRPLYTEFLRVKRHDENVSKRWGDTLETRVLAWIDGYAIATLADITRENLLALRSRDGVKARTRIADMTAVSTFLDYLVAEKKLIANPLDDIPRPKADATDPQTLSAAQIKTLLQTAQEMENGRLLRLFAIGIFAGLRPGEIARLTEDRIRLKTAKPVIRVVGGKKRQRLRVVPILPVLRAWLTVAPAHVPDLDGKDRSLFDRIREAAGLIKWTGNRTGKRKTVFSHWQEDVMRHTFISLRMGMTHDENVVAMEAGNSPDTIHAHYLSILDDEEVEAMQQIVPAGWKAIKDKTGWQVKQIVKKS